MKQFVKTLVSSLIVLSIVATMCVIGISAVAATEKKEFILISETAEKKVSDMTTTHTVNGTKDFSVVSVNTLTGGDTYTGTATTAYQAKITAGKVKDGFWVSAPNPDFSEFAYDFENNYLEAWIYVSDIAAFGNGVIRFYTSKEPNADGSHVETYICQGGLADMGITKNGWNKVNLIMNWNTNDWQFGHEGFANHFFSNGAQMVGVGLHTHGGASSDVTIAIASMKITRTSTVVPASVTKDYIISATDVEYPGTVLEKPTTFGTATYNGAVRGAYDAQNSNGLLMRKGFPAKDMSADGTTVSLWLYVGDTSKAKDVVVELGNIWNQNDVHEFQYAILAKDMKQGWNEYVTAVPKTAGSGKTFHAKSVTRVRMWTTYVAEADVKVGEMYVNSPKAVTTDSNAVGQTIVSPSITKQVSDLEAINVTGSSVLSVADTSKLTGGASGVPSSQAYMVTIDAGGHKNGFEVPVLDTDWSEFKASVTNGGNAGKGYGVNMWIWVEDPATFNFINTRFYDENKRNNGIDGWCYQIGGDHHANSTKTLVKGWNNVIYWFPETGDADTDRTHVPETNGEGKKVVKMSLAVWNSTQKTSFAIACARLVTKVKDVEAAWDGTVEVDESEIADFAPADKAAGDYLPTKADKAVVSVVDISTLTGGKYEGANKTAYKVDFSEGAARKEGVYTSLEAPVRMKSAGAEKDYTFEAWIWAEKEVNDYIFQFYGDNLEKDTAVGANHTEKWIYRISNDSNDATKCITLKAGWNHIKVTLDSTFAQLGSSSNDHTKAAYTSFTTNQVMTGFSIHDNADGATPKRISLAIADAKFYKTSAYKEPVKDTREYLISAKEGEVMVNGTLEAADYLNTGNGAYGGTGVVRAQKNLDGVDITDRQITLWLYVEEPSKSSIDIELTSSGKCDSNELCFRLGANEFKKGWNKYVLDYKIAKAASADGVFGYQHINGGGTTDLTKINYVRIFGTDNVDVKVGAMYFTDSEMNVGGGAETGDAVNVTMIVVAILLAAMAASVTVYFGKKVR